MASREIQHLHPVPAFLFGTLAERVARRFKHLEIFPVCTWRSPEEQAAEFAKGRSSFDPASAKTTNAAPGESWHNMTTPDGRPASLAIDYAFRQFDPLTLNPKPRTFAADAPLDLYKYVGDEAAILGFEPGVFWPSEDGPHLEWHPGFDRNEGAGNLAEKMAIYNAGLYKG